MWYMVQAMIDIDEKANQKLLWIMKGKHLSREASRSRKA
jgi:hypothetical protein